MPFTSLKDLFTQTKSPALWECPIQQGVPILLEIAQKLLLWVAAFAFLIGALLAIYYFVTNFGSDDKIKKGKSTLTYIFVGAAVVMLSQSVIQGIAKTLITAPAIKTPGPTNECLQQQRGEVTVPQVQGS